MRHPRAHRFVLVLLVSAAYAQALPAPSGADKVTWQAEQATPSGDWQAVADVQADGGAYLEARSAGTTTTLSFPFTVSEPTTLRVRPVWWRTGDQTSATRYPYPFEANPGPDDLTAAGGRLFFAAPTAGRIGVVDPVTETLVKVIDVGGYLSDLVADPSGQLVCAADALGSRIVVLDAATLSIKHELKVPAEPWSLAVGAGRVFVACRGGRAVVSVVPANGAVSAPRPLPAEPTAVEWFEDAQRLLVRFTPRVLNLYNLEPIPADEPGYGGWPYRTSVRLSRTTMVDAPQHGALRVQTTGQPAEAIDVSAVTGAAAPPGGRRSPELMVQGGDLLWFTSPANGALGVYDLKAKQLQPAIPLGGSPADLTFSPDGKLLYVADAAADCVHMVDVAKRAVVGKIDVPATPSCLVAVKQIALQRPENEPPFKVAKLFVVSRGANTVTVIDTETNQVVRSLSFDVPIRRVAEVPVATADWWGTIPLDRIPARLTPKLAVEVVPQRLTASLEPAEGEGSSTLPKHNTAKLTAGTAEKTFTAGALALQVDGQRWIDVSAATDPQLAPPPPLRPSDRPGAITVALDDGPAYDWLRGIWHAPDSQLFLVGDSEEFWRWNAQAFRVQPGAHVLRVTARRPLARLDALQVWRENAGGLRMALHAEPRRVHDEVPLTGYDGVFYDREPVRFSVELTNQAAAQHGRLVWRLTNYMDEPVAEGSREVALKPGASGQVDLPFATKDWGRHHLTLTLSTELGTQVQEHHFLRMPKLEHPRMLFRKEQLPEVRARIAAHPVLYQRYTQWLSEKLKAEGDRFPDLWLPKTLSADELAKVIPPGEKNAQKWNWREYELGWRLLAVQFAATYLQPDNPLFREKLQPAMSGTALSRYCAFHHHGPYFPGAETDLWDLASDDRRAASPIGAELTKAQGDMNLLPWTLGSLEEPLTPQKRALLFKLMSWLNNAERYTASHVGRRGGTLWQNPWTGCHCQNHGMLLSLLYFRSFFAEPRLYEKRVFQGFFTFLRYVDPLNDNRHLLPDLRGPLGEPARWLHGSVSRHPLEKSLYFWDDWLKQAEGDLGSDPKALDDLFELKGYPRTGPVVGNAHHFVTAVAAPIALALGWYDPAAPKTETAELPPTTLCEQDGWVPMRSGWDPQATEVSFVCGTRDHTCRTRPGHFTINKAGEYLIGTPALTGDDGNNTCSWGNTLVVDDDWIASWRTNLTHPRDGEYFVINRFSGPTWRYLARDRALTGVAPAEGGWGGGLDLHGHTETCYLREGRIIAYQTRPEFDYAAGDATNAWPLAKVEQHTRQLVYLRPGTVVLYDRVRLGAGGRAARLVMTTAATAEVQGASFTVTRAAARLNGQVLLPGDAALSTPAPYPGFVWKGQALLQAEPARPEREQEFLTVLSASLAAEPVPAPAKLIREGDQVGVEVAGARVLFARTGSVGGRVAWPGAAPVVLPQRVDDTYRYWSTDPRYPKWRNEERFRFVVLKGDLDGN